MHYLSICLRSSIFTWFFVLVRIFNGEAEKTQCLKTRSDAIDDDSKNGDERVHDSLSHLPPPSPMVVQARASHLDQANKNPMLNEAKLWTNKRLIEQPEIASTGMRCDDPRT